LFPSPDAFYSTHLSTLFQARRFCRPCAVTGAAIRLAMTLPLAHSLQRRRFTKVLIGASGLRPKRARTCRGNLASCPQFRQRTTNTPPVSRSTTALFRRGRHPPLIRGPSLE